MVVRQCFISVLVFVATAPAFFNDVRSASAPPLQPNEKIVKTRDGCGFVVDSSKPGASYEIEAKSKLTWGGPCVAGLAMGEGWISDGDYRYADIPPLRGWAWYGRIFGSVGSRDSIAFVWDGISVSYTTLSITAPVWSKQHNERSRVSDGDSLVMTNTRGCILESKQLPECKQENKFEIPGLIVLDLKNKKSAHYNCPDLRSTNGCEALWAEHAGPVIGRIKAFLAENEPKVEVRKREIAPLVASWRPAPNAKQQDEARHAALRSAQLAERQQREAKHAATLENMKRETERLQRETDALRAESAEAERKAKEERARDRRETLNLLGNAAVAASGGQNSSERRKLALESLQQAGGGSGLGATGANFNIKDIIVLDGIGATSRFECMRIEWVDETRPTTNYLGNIYRGPQYGLGTNDNYYYDRRVLVASNQCEEEIMYFVAVCHDHNMLEAGGKGRDAWAAGELVGVGPGYYTGRRLTNGQGIVIAETYRHGTRENADRKQPMQVAVGAWLPDAIFLPENRGRTEAGEKLNRRHHAIHLELNKVTTGKASTYALNEWHANTPSQFRNDRDGYTHNSCQTAKLKEVWNSTP